MEFITSLLTGNKAAHCQLQLLILICRLCKFFVMIVIISTQMIKYHSYMSGFSYYTQIQYLTVTYHHSNSVTYIGSCQHIKT